MHQIILVKYRISFSKYITIIDKAVYKMAAGYNRVLPFHYAVPNGHMISYNFKLHKFAERPSLVYQNDILTCCYDFPTSWSFEVRLQKNLAEGILPCSVTLTRHDQRVASVQASIEVSFSNGDNRPYFNRPRILTTMSMLPGDVLEDNISDILQSIEMVEAVNEMLFITVSIRILNCHSNIESLFDE